ncbi:MAG: leucine-rich repeat domain-containing protein, partial [archaeon]|nr:leucine-rich repeat domain-containing protein [archaeon]
SKYAFAGDKTLTYVEFGDGLKTCSTVAFDEVTFLDGTTVLKQAAKNFVGEIFVGEGDGYLHLLRHDVYIEYNVSEPEQLSVKHGRLMNEPKPVYKYFLDPEHTIEWDASTPVTEDLHLYAIETTGPVGKKAIWTVDPETWTMSVTGTGATWNFESTDDQAWRYFEDKVLHIVVGDGITDLGERLFMNLYTAKTVELSDSVKYIQMRAFSNDTSVDYISFGEGQTTIYGPAFTGLNFVLTDGSEVPVSSINMGGRVFERNEYGLALVDTCDDADGIHWEFDWDTKTLTLTPIDGDVDMASKANVSKYSWYAYRPVVETIVIEEGINTVAQYSFRNYPVVSEIYLPDSVNTVYKYAFAGDKAL